MHTPITCEVDGGPVISPLIAMDLQDALLIVSNDLERLQRLLGDTCGELSSALYEAMALIEGSYDGDGDPAQVLAAIDVALRRGVSALQFEDMASQLIAHTRSRLRHSADQLAAAALADDEDGAALVEDAPLRPNPVTQDEMDAGSVELF